MIDKYLTCDYCNYKVLWKDVKDGKVKYGFTLLVKHIENNHPIESYKEHYRPLPKNLIESVG